MVAGGVGAVTAKTVVAPLDRIKILLQTGATEDGVRLSSTPKCPRTQIQSSSTVCCHVTEAHTPNDRRMSNAYCRWSIAGNLRAV